MAGKPPTVRERSKPVAVLFQLFVWAFALVTVLGSLNDSWWLGVIVGMTWIVLVVGIDRKVHPMVPIRWKTALREKARARRMRAAR